MASFYGGEKGQPFKAHAFELFSDMATNDSNISIGQYFFITNDTEEFSDSNINFKGSLWEKKYTATSLTITDDKKYGIVSSGNSGKSFSLKVRASEGEEATTISAQSEYYELITYLEGRIPQFSDLTDGKAIIQVTEIAPNQAPKGYVELQQDDGSKFSIKLELPRAVTFTTSVEPNTTAKTEINVSQSEDNNGDVNLHFTLPRAATFTQEDNTILNTPAQGFTAELEPTNNGDYILKTTKARSIKIAEDTDGNKLIDSSNTLDTAKSIPRIEIDTDENGDLKFDFNFPRPIGIADVETTNTLNPKDDQDVIVETDTTTGDLKFNFSMRRPIGVALDSENNKIINSNNNLTTANATPKVDISTTEDTGDLKFDFQFPRPIQINYPEGLGEKEVSTISLAPNQNPQARVNINQDDGDLEFSFSLPNAATFTQRDLSQGENAQFNTPAVGFTANLQPELNEQNQNTGNYILETTKARGIQVANQKNEDGTDKIDDQGNTIPDITITNSELNPNTIPKININTNDDGDLTFNFNMPRPIAVGQNAVFTTSINPNQDPEVEVGTTDETGDLTFNFKLPRNVKFGIKYNIIGSNIDPSAYLYELETKEGEKGYSPKVGYVNNDYEEYVNPIFIALTNQQVANLNELEEKDYIIEFFIPQSAIQITTGVKVTTETLAPNKEPQIYTEVSEDSNTDWDLKFKVPRSARFKIAETKENPNIFSDPEVKLYTISGTYISENKTYYSVEEDASRGFEKLVTDTYSVGDYILELTLPSGEIFGENPQIDYSEVDAGVTPTISLTRNETKGNYVLSLQTPKAWKPNNITITSVPPSQKDNLNGSITLGQKESYDIELEVPQGDPAGFGEITTTVSVKDYGTKPEVNITPDENSPATAKSFNFDFAIPEGKPFEFSGTYTWDEVNKAETEVIENSYILINIENKEEGHDNGLYVYKVIKYDKEKNEKELEYIGPFISGDTIKGAYKIPFGEIYNEENGSAWFDLIKEKQDNAWYCTKDGYEYPLNYIKENEIGFGLIVSEENNEANGKFNYLILKKENDKVYSWEEKSNINLGFDLLTKSENDLSITIAKDNEALAEAQGYGAIAFGVNSRAYGSYSVTEGLYTQTGEKDNTNEACGQGAHVEGCGYVKDNKIYYNKASGQGAHAEGIGDKDKNKPVVASGAGSHAEGQGTTASGQASHAEGARSVANGPASHAEGANTIAYGERTHAEGESTIAFGQYSHSEGYKTVACSGRAHAEGHYSIACNEASHAEGYNASYKECYVTTKDYSACEYYIEDSSITPQVNDIIIVRSSGNYCTIAGVSEENDDEQNRIYVTLKSNLWASSVTKQLAYYHSFKNGGAYGLGSHTEGVYTFAKGKGAHAEGCNSGDYGNENYVQNIAGTKGSHAEGLGSWAGVDSDKKECLGDSEAWGAHAEGVRTISNGHGSHAEGKETRALGEASHSEGLGTIAEDAYMHVQGKYNATTAGMAHVVGWGSKTTPKDIHTLDTSGNAWFSGEVTVGSAKTPLATKKELSSLTAMVETVNGTATSNASNISQIQTQINSINTNKNIGSNYAQYRKIIISSTDIGSDAKLDTGVIYLVYDDSED